MAAPQGRCPTASANAPRAPAAKMLTDGRRTPRPRGHSRTVRRGSATALCTDTHRLNLSSGKAAPVTPVHGDGSRGCRARG